VSDSFVRNVADAPAFDHPVSGIRILFESPDAVFPQIGVNIQVLQPGQPNAKYHSEAAQEDFLVLGGECLLIVEGEERQLRAWDLVHCPPGTTHAFVGAGDGPCVILMVGARTDEGTILYPRDETALEHGAGVEEDTEHPRVAYAPFGHWRLGRPDVWDELPLSDKA
jgi:uncharacterized cupin superfamily protein